VLALALTFFLITNPIGGTPTILALVKDYEFKKQQSIIFRETFFALLIALFFQYFGEVFLKFLKIQDFVVLLAGGLLLLCVAVGMLFPHRDQKEASRPKQEPFIVPIATPLLSGPGLLAMIMFNSKLASSVWEVSLAICLAWVGVFIVLGAAPYINKLIGKSGLAALEQVMGMLVTFVSIEMLIKGSNIFIDQL
jgi:multiple antibiotic resistance protein